MLEPLAAPRPGSRVLLALKEQERQIHERQRASARWRPVVVQLSCSLAGVVAFVGATHEREIVVVIALATIPLTDRILTRRLPNG
jgi:amino acid permease